MNRGTILITTALAAVLACGPLATAAVAQARPDAPQAAPHTATGTPRPGPDRSVRPKQEDATAPTLPSAPLKGLPTLREAQRKGLLSKPVKAAGAITPLGFPEPRCGTPPQGWGYHDYLAPGECLTPETYIAANVSLHRWYELWMQENGNVVLYDHDSGWGTYKIVWQSGTRGWHTSLWMQRDGNVVVYDGQGNPIWALGTDGCGGQGAWLRVQADANLVLYTGDWKPIWARFNGPSSRPC